MNNFLLLWLSLSLSGSLVAAALYLLKPLLCQFSKTWQYYIWLLVILRLLIPISPAESIVGGVFRQIEVNLAKADAPAQALSGNIQIANLDSPDTPEMQNNGIQEVPANTAVYSLWKNHIWGILWLVAAMTCLLRKVYGYRQLVKAVNRESNLLIDEQQLTVFQMVSAEMGIRRRIPLYKNSLVQAPMLIGVIKPVIILPAKEIPISELKYIFRHELTHFRRKDFFYKWLTEIAVCLHWFNPFAYWVRKQINRDCEFSCDEAVIARLSNTERQSYGDTLLNSIEVNHRGGKNVVSLSLNEDGLLIKERLCAIMKYRRKSKLTVLIASVITSVLLCGTVFAGAYKGTVGEQAQTDAAAKQIQISGKISSGGKISLGSQQLLSGTECRVLLTWTGNDKLTVLCTSSRGTEKLYLIENGKAATFQIDTDDEYTIAIKNNNAYKINNVNGSIGFSQSTLLSNASTVQSVVYENGEMRRYEGADGHPYAHDTMTNHTKLGMLSDQYGMLAFDKEGNPLKIDWWSMDTDIESTYFNLNEISRQLSPGETYDVYGGWSLNIGGADLAVEKIAYVLYCSKEIVFEDGTVWVNPDFDKWRSTYEGKKIDVDILENYYPYEQKITSF